MDDFLGLCSQKYYLQFSNIKNLLIFCVSETKDVSEFHLLADGGFSFVVSQYNNTLMTNDTQFTDFNDNQSIYAPLKSICNETTILDTVNVEEKEPPLLEELEIYPELIKERAMLFINPLAKDKLAVEKFLVDPDLAGPLFFFFLFGSCLFLAGKLYIFSHLYTLSVVSVLVMHQLLKQMCSENCERFVRMKMVASALGYGMLHLVWFAFIGIFMRLNSLAGIACVTPAVVLPTIATHRILSSMSNQANNGPLIAYPTAVVYILFAFLVIF